MDRIKITKISCISGPQETIEIPYSQEFIDNLKPKTSTSYYRVEVYEKDKLVNSIAVDLFNNKKFMKNDRN